MKLTSQEARDILENARGKTEYDSWIDHSICVGNTGARIAEALNEKGCDVDAEKTKTLGYVHDIGKMIALPYGHEINGYNYMKEQGYDEEYYNICIAHSYLNNDINCAAGGVNKPEDNPFITDFVKNHKYTIEERIINLCDLMCPPGGKVYTVDKRLIDLILRRGAHTNTQYHVIETYKLKAYFDELLGYNLYDLFPEIKENL